jgi:dimeric dUTPase (all-alpha-NTP-PPase superfamily)
MKDFEWWWTKLTPIEKNSMLEKYIINNGPHYRAWLSLTKEEIESMFNKESNKE